MAKKAAKKKAGKKAAKAKKVTAADKKLYDAQQAYYAKVAKLSAEGDKLGLGCIWIEREPIMEYLNKHAADELEKEHDLTVESVSEDFINEELAQEVNDNIKDNLKAATWNMLSNL